MKNKTIYKIINNKNLPKYRKQVIQFYNRYFPEESNQVVVKNSPLLFIAIINNKIIACCRLLTDFSRYGILFDLIVKKSKRNQGIGKTLCQKALIYCQEHKIKKLFIVTDLQIKWLSDFYQKIGFKKAKNQLLLKESSQ
jgi:N-acetylglutamate synthase-like GNAT family acetyltransferase